MPLPTVSTVTRPRSWGYNCRIGPTLYRLVSLAEARPIVETAPLQAPRIDTAANPEDFRLEEGMSFSLSDFSGGEGLDFAHRRNATPRDPTRFWDSDGVDISPPDPGRTASLQLLKTASVIDASTNTALSTTFDGTSIFVAEGNNVTRVDTPLGTPASATEDPHAGQGAVAVQDLAVVGDLVYAALGASGVHERSSAGTWTHWSDVAAVKVWGVKGQVLASTGTELYKCAAAAASNLLHTLPSGESWTDVIDAADFILAAATDGTIYAFSYTEDTATIKILTRTPFSADQSITALAWHPSGLVFVGTKEPTSAGAIGRLHHTTLADNGTVTDATLVRQWGDQDAAVDHSPSVIFADYRDVYVGIREATNSYLWRYDLTTGGRARHISAGAGAQIQGLLALSDRLFFTKSGAGLYREATTYVSTGYLISALADHYTAQEKSWAGVRVDADLPTGTVVEVYVSSDPDAILDPAHSSWSRVAQFTKSDTSELTLSRSSRYLAIQLKLFASSDDLSTPTVRSFSIRSFPGPGDIVLNLPINVSDQMEMPGRRRIPAPGFGRTVYNSLKGIEGTNQYVELFDPDERVRGEVKSVSSPVVALTRRGARTLVATVVIRGRRVGEENTSTSAAMLGTETLGVTTFGGVE